MHDHDFFRESLDRVNFLNFPVRYKADITFVQQAGIIGLVIAYILSWTISTRRNWFWLSAALSFILIFFMRIYGLLLWEKLHNVFYFPGKIFKDESIWAYVLNGAIMTGIGLYILLSPTIKKYIDKGEFKPVGVSIKVPKVSIVQKEVKPRRG